MNFFIDPILGLEEYNDILASLKSGKFPVNIIGPSDTQKVHISYSICKHLDLKGIFIAVNDMQARKAYEDFSFFLSDDVLLLPSKEIMLYDVEAKSYDQIYQRLITLDRIIKGDYRFIVTSAEAVMQKLIPKELFEKSIFEFSLGDRIDLDSFAYSLLSTGYERVETVEGMGQFAIRGGIIDIFPLGSDSAVRMELFDDEIDSVRSFDTITQRSVDRVDKIRIIPAREVIYPPEDMEDIISRIEKDLHKHTAETGRKNSTEYIEHVGEKIRSDILRLKTDYYFPGIDRFIPFIIDKPSFIMDYTEDMVIFADEPLRIKQRIENSIAEHREICGNLLHKGVILPRTYQVNFEESEIEERFKSGDVVYLSAMPLEGLNNLSSRTYNIVSRQIGSYQGHMELLTEDIRNWKQKNYRIVVLSGAKGRGEKLRESFEQDGIEAVYNDNTDFTVQPGQVVITHGSLNKGFEYPSIGWVLISDKEAFGADKKPKRPHTKRKGSKINLFTDLNPGDYVVHQAHGIGQYVGIEKLAVENVKRDYLKIRYNEGDYLYIPTSQLDLIQKYIGSEGKAPKLNKLGGSEWFKTRKRVKESLREIAEELIRLYATRQSAEGYAFSEDSVWQKQFEDLFPYEETEDQIKCIEEIKKDMELKRPMDRLLCGDVGYGKTEVAERAVFKAATNGKQAAYLVPTTVLAQQHYNTFKERMKDFPVTIEVISRFRSQAEQKNILKNVKAGVVDILIGTHRLLQKDILFKDLGLLVVDEEQRFGVTHKEKLKSLKPNVDVLTLTATPIPRTLHMSLVGIRDISIIEDPPENRYPVQTYVMEYNHDVIRDAITRELARNGQVFYLYNRVRTIEKKAAELQALVPDARIAIAHGQMSERELEDIINDFINDEYDVLVCTTIIESGLDMPNVNTIIIEDADKMGLAQLHQLRGRVGRSNKMAYAYITYKRDKMLSEVAEKRLQAIKEFTELGSGFKIAMRDLEIRGAGNLLGAEQHGHMEAVGYDMYCRLLDEAVRELKGETIDENETEMTIDINVSAYIDNEYISAEDQKIDMYKKIASLQDQQDMEDVRDELIDRYGDIPEPVHNLLEIAYIKALAKETGFSSITEKNDTILLQLKNGRSLNIEGLGNLTAKYRRQLMFNAGNAPYLLFRTLGIERKKVLENIKFLLQDVKSFAV
ncbi:MAG: transcription-repair coupling factor [Bacillota bacterium]|nr:transcription-repair coupling factor [Bacillota bacterium]